MVSCITRIIFVLPSGLMVTKKPKTQTMNNTITIPNFKLFFGKYKGMPLSLTPKSYQKWLVQTDFFKGLQIKYPIKNRVGNSDGSWYEIDLITIDLTETKNRTVRTEQDPEQKHWNGYATYLERNSFD